MGQTLVYSLILAALATELEHMGQMVVHILMQ